ncbi:RNAP sigma-32 factor-like protein [Salicola phage SCTP-2]|nr:RNAP sigma-32 factor-like protein [Salicola phage SCTP-2]
MNNIIPVCSNDEEFIKSIMKISTPDRETEQSMFKYWNETGDQETARSIVLSHMKFVVHIASNYKYHGIPQAELIQQGSIGLMKALERFDVSKGWRFATYAAHWIKYAISEFVITNVKTLKIATTKPQRKLFYNLNRYISDGSRWLNYDEKQYIADELDVKISDVETMEERLKQKEYYVTYMDSDQEDQWDGQAYKESWLADGNESLEDQYIETVDNNKQIQLMRNQMNQLNDRDRYIIERRHIDEDKATLNELAEIYDVSCERVRQLENNALKKLRKALTTQ